MRTAQSVIVEQVGSEKNESLILRQQPTKSLVFNDLDTKVRTEFKTKLHNDISEENLEVIKKFFLNDYDNDLNKRWYVRYSVRDKRGRVVVIKKYGGINRLKTIELRRESALKLIIDLEKKINNVYVPRQHGKGLETELFAILEKLKPTLRKKSFYTYYSKLRTFISWCNVNQVTKLSDVDLETARRFQNYILQEKKLSNATYNSYKITLSIILKHVESYESPFKKIKSLKKQTVSTMFFQKNQMTILKLRMENDYPQLWLACRFMYYLLIRPDELRLLKIGDIDFENARVLVRATESKNLVGSYVVIPNELLSVIMEMKLYALPSDHYVFGKLGETGPLHHNKGYLSKLHKNVLDSLGFNTVRYKFYSWKPSGVAGLVLAGVHIKYIQLQGRWSSLDQVNTYLKNFGLQDMGNLKDLHKMF